MKALLIYPPTLNMIRTNLPVFIDKELGVYPPLGLLYIAAYAQKNTNFKIQLLDCHAEKLNYQDIEKRIIQEGPDIIGIQAFTFSLIDALKVADIAKKVKPKIHVCMGGPHVNIYPLETLKSPSVDSVVKGEGEYAFAEICNMLENSGEFSNIKGILFKKNGEIVDTGIRPFLTNQELDSLPHPARILLETNNYYSLLAQTNPITTVMTSRGCPFKCIFCDRPQMGKVFRYRNAANIMSELETCLDMGIREFFFYDDTFTVNRNRVLDLCEKLIESGANRRITWDIRSRLDTVDEEMLKRMHQAGCKRIHYGVEAGTERILKILKKDITLKQVLNIFKTTSKYGIQTLAYFILGNPSETRSEMQETISFSKKLDPDYIHFSLMTPYPGTELYKLALEKGVAKSDYWKKFAESPDKNFEPMFWEENLNRLELNAMLQSAYKSFYLRPGYIFKQILKLRSTSELKRKFKAAIKVIKY